MQVVDITPYLISDKLDWGKVFELDADELVIDHLDFGAAKIYMNAQKRFPANTIFKECTFPSGYALNDLTFEGHTVFAKCHFEEPVRFHSCHFKGPVNFHSYLGGDFTGSIFDDTVSARNCRSSTPVNFTNSTFRSNARFINCEFEHVARLSGASFDRFLDLSGATFHRALHMDNVSFRFAPPHLIEITAHGDVELVGATVSVDPLLKKYNGKERVQYAVEAATDARRLQRLAESGDVFDVVLDCHAVWLRCQEVFNSWWMPRLWPAVLYRTISNYGRSLVRPLIAAIVVTAIFASVYGYILRVNAIQPTVAELAHYSSTKTVPIPGLSVQGMDKRLVEALRVSDLSMHSALAWSVISTVHGLIGIVLIFLLGLALRNRFRVL